MTLPPLDLHSSAVALTTPLPLQEFCPAHEFPAPAQPPWPLQALMPVQLTLSPAALSSARAVTAPERNSAAAAPAIRIPLLFLVMILSSSCGVVGARWTPTGRGALHESATAARPGPGGTAEAVRAGRDRLVDHATDVVEVPDGAGTVGGEGNLEHLVEIAVVERAVPPDAHEVPTHEAFDGAGIEVVHQETHVPAVLAIAPELIGEAGDRHVRQGEQLVELDSQLPSEVLAVPRGQLRLGPRQERAERVVDEVETQGRAGKPVAEIVQPPERPDAAV